jgi:hypothetical protein
MHHECSIPQELIKLMSFDAGTSTWQRGENDSDTDYSAVAACCGVASSAHVRELTMESSGSRVQSQGN